MFFKMLFFSFKLSSIKKMIKESVITEDKNNENTEGIINI